jgi:excinuclease ABC subunit B
MRTAMGEMTRRRAIQEAYNVEHGITPQSIIKQIDDVMSSVYERDYSTIGGSSLAREGVDGLEGIHSQKDLDAHLAGLQESMRQAAANLDFEKAAALRDQIKRLRNPDLVLRWPVGRT